MKKVKLFALSASLLMALSVSACGTKVKGVERTYVNSSGELVVVYTDGTEENLGHVKGEKGDKGDSGATGSQGIKGDSGAQGPKGDTGSQGQKGDSGSQGPKGDTGSQGPKGNSGATGSQGPKGDTGSQGADGANGLTPYIGANGNWWIGEQDTNIKATGDKGDTGADGAEGLTPYVGENDNWWIGDQDTGIKAAGAQGEQGNTGANGETPYIGENGNWWIGEQDTNIKAVAEDGKQGEAGRSIVSIESDYELDPETGIEYYVFTIHYSDDTSEVNKIEIPKKISSIEYLGEQVYEIVKDEDYPVLKLRATYDDETTQDVVITDEMYVVEGDYVKPNFAVRGIYKAKVLYKGLNLLFTVKVVDPELVTAISYPGVLVFTQVEEGDEPTLKLNVVYDDGDSTQIDITEDMYVVEGDYVKPNFQEPGTYKVKISYCDVETTFILTIKALSKVLISNDQFVYGCYYNNGSFNTTYSQLKTHHEFFAPQKIKVVVEDSNNNVSTQPYQVCWSLYDKDGKIINPNDTANALKPMTNGVIELDLANTKYKSQNPVKARVDVMIFNGSFTKIPSTAVINIYSMEDTPIEIEENPENPGTEDPQTPEDPTSTPLVANSEFIVGCYYNNGQLKNSTAPFNQLKTHEKFIAPQNIRVVLEDKQNDVSSQSYQVYISAYDSTGKILNPDSVGTYLKPMTNGVYEVNLKTLYPTAAKFRVDVMNYSKSGGFKNISPTATINVYSLEDEPIFLEDNPENPGTEDPETPPTYTVLVDSSEFITGCYYNNGNLQTSDPYFSKVKCHNKFIAPQKVKVTVEDTANNVNDYPYKATWSAYDSDGNILNKNNTAGLTAFVNGALEFDLAKLYPTAAKFRIDVLCFAGGTDFRTIPATASFKIYSLEQQSGQQEETESPYKTTLVANDAFVQGAFYDLNQPNNPNQDKKAKRTDGAYAKFKTHDSLIAKQDFMIEVTPGTSADLSKYCYVVSFFDEDGTYEGRMGGGVQNLKDGKLEVSASDITTDYFRVSIFFYPGTFADIPSGTTMVVKGK